MSFSDIESRVVVSGFSLDDKAAILAAMRFIYEGSATARGFFHRWLSDNSDNIEVIYTPGVLNAPPDEGKLFLDLKSISNALFIDNNGTAVRDSLVSMLAHELVHALEGTDNDIREVTDTDYKGTTVPVANTIYEELNLGVQQNSYISYDIEGSILSAGFQYTEGVAIDRSVVVGSSWDSSP